MFAVRSLLILLAAARAAGTSAPSPVRGGWHDLGTSAPLGGPNWWPLGPDVPLREVGSSTAARGMRAIFLDIDGVLLPFGEDAAANAEGIFSPESLEALREIIRSSGKVPALGSRTSIGATANWFLHLECGATFPAANLWSMV